MSDNYQDNNFNWFTRLLQSIIQSYAHSVNLEFFQKKYPGLPIQTIAERRIKAAANWAGLIGFLSGGLIAVASTTTAISALSTVASGFLTSPVTLPILAVTVPVGMAAFTAEISMLVKLQLHLAYDLFVLYGLPLNLDDPEDLQKVVSIALGIKSAELTGQALQRVIPQLAPSLLRKAMRAGLVRRKFQEWVARRLTWAFARKYLAEGMLIRFLVPGISIFTATAWDYVSTKSIGGALQARIRRQGLAAKQVEKLSLTNLDNPELLLRAALGIALSDDDLSETEIVFYSKLVEKLRQIYGDSSVDRIKEVAFLDWDEIVNDLADVTDAEQQLSIYNTLLTAAVVEGQLQRKKIKRLKQASQCYNLPLDLKMLKEQIAVFKEPQPLRTCLLTVLLLFALLLSSCFCCSFAGWLQIFGK